MRLEVFSDASLGNVKEGKSQIGYMIGFVDERGCRCPVAWNSKLGSRVARSTIEVEAISFGEAIFLRKMWKEISGEVLEIVGRTDSKTLERVIKSNTAVTNKRLRIDLVAIEEVIEDGNVCKVMWIDKGEQVANSLSISEVYNGNKKRGRKWGKTEVIILSLITGERINEE